MLQGFRAAAEGQRQPSHFFYSINRLFLLLVSISYCISLSDSSAAGEKASEWGSGGGHGARRRQSESRRTAGSIHHSVALPLLCTSVLSVTRRPGQMENIAALFVVDFQLAARGPAAEGERTQLKPSDQLTAHSC